MKTFRSAALSLAKGLGFAIAATVSASAWGQADPKIDITVEPLPEKVTLSRPAKKTTLALETYAAYLVKITNGSTNTLNRVFLTGTATNIGATDLIEYDSYVANKTGDTCDVGAAVNTVSCSLESLEPGADTSFVVVFKAPQNGERIDFDWTAGGFEGNGNGNGCCSQPGLAQTILVDPSTDPTFTTQARTFVRPDVGGTLFTGNEAITTSADGWTTIVQVPWYLSQAYTTADIFEDSYTSGCPSYSTGSTCFVSALSIPGTFDALQITIRLDKSYFHLGRTDPATLSLWYTGDAGVTTIGNPSPHDYVTYPHRLKLCSEDIAEFTQAPWTFLEDDIPLAGRPCMSESPKVIPNGFAIKDLRGDLEFNVRARDNGLYEQ